MPAANATDEHRPGDPAPAWWRRIEPVLISAPFGNYLQPVCTTPTLGTFTAARRRGRVWRVVRTVRYYRRLGAWVNRIGLRNPGVDWLVRRAERRPESVRGKVVSIHGFTERDWAELLDKARGLGATALELNMSCPNVGEVNWPAGLFSDAAAVEREGLGVVVKLPPIRYDRLADAALAAGLRAFHCANTLPVPAGGMSGEPLRPLAVRCVRTMRERLPPGAGLLIGGGGVRAARHVDEFADAGADRVAVGSYLMHPWCLVSTARLDPIVARARERLGEPTSDDADQIGRSDTENA
jgi:dihydroorotate dehydrogenase